MEFSGEVLKYLNQEYYVYCLVDSRNNEVFYVGKGKNQRVFDHEKWALKNNKDKLLQEESKEKRVSENPDYKFERIKKINEDNHEVLKYLLNFHLTEKEAFACENTIINYFNCVKGFPLTNKVSGHGNTGIEVKALEKNFGKEPISINDIKSDELILAVKIIDSLDLDTDETKQYSFYDRDNNNLKSRTLGNWKVSRSKVNKIKYLIGVNTGISNSVVSAYKIDRFEEGTDEKGKRRFCFHSSYTSKETLEELGLENKRLEDLQFTRNSIRYINN